MDKLFLSLEKRVVTILIDGNLSYIYRQMSKKDTMTAKKLIIEIAEITSVGLEVFGDVKKFKLWLDTPNYSLGNLKPKKLLKNSYGKDLVISELTRINYGILV